MILPFIKTYKKIATLFIILVIFFIYFLNKYNNILDKKNLDIFVSNQIQIIENELENQKNQALSLALMFSRNQEIIKSLENKNNIELKKELLKLLNIILYALFDSEVSSLSLYCVVLKSYSLFLGLFCHYLGIHSTSRQKIQQCALA